MPRGLCTPLGHGKRNGGPGFLQGRHSAFPPEKRLLAVMSRKDGFSGAFHATKKREGRACNVFGSAADLGLCRIRWKRCVMPSSLGAIIF